VVGRGLNLNNDNPDKLQRVELAIDSVLDCFQTDYEYFTGRLKPLLQFCAGKGGMHNIEIIIKLVKVN